MSGYAHVRDESKPEKLNASKCFPLCPRERTSRMQSACHIMVLRDGTIRGGGPFFYTVGSFTYCDGKWKGEITSQEHSPIVGSHPWALKVVSIGFSGTYSDDGAELEAIALAGKQSFRFKSIYQLPFRGLKRDFSISLTKSL